MTSSSVAFCSGRPLTAKTSCSPLLSTCLARAKGDSYPAPRTSTTDNLVLVSRIHLRRKRNVRLVVHMDLCDVLLVAAKLIVKYQGP